MLLSGVLHPHRSFIFLYWYHLQAWGAGVNESQDCNGPYSGVAALEWFILLIFDLYILSICMDM